MQDEEELDESDSKTSVASEADEDCPSKDSNNEGPESRDNFDLQTASEVLGKDHMVCTLPVMSC